MGEICLNYTTYRCMTRCTTNKNHLRSAKVPTKNAPSADLSGWPRPMFTNSPFPTASETRTFAIWMLLQHQRNLGVHHFDLEPIKSTQRQGREIGFGRRCLLPFHSTHVLYVYIYIPAELLPSGISGQKYSFAAAKCHVLG